MSGIFGIADSRAGTPIQERLHAMGQTLSHRPWYQVETYHEAQVGLGRVGIGIFNRQRQPMQSADGKITVFFSGELYHTGELMDHFGHFILEQYQQEGMNFISKLRGIFILAIWDRAAQTLNIVNDRGGLYPLVYAHHQGRLLFAPEMKGIFCDPEIPKDLDYTALAEYVRFQVLLGDKTFFEELHLLPNASWLHYDLRADHLEVQPYWDFSHLPATPLSITFDEAVEEVAHRLRNAVRRCTNDSHHRRLGVFLSGGMDARSILGMIEPHKLPVTTITYGSKNSRDAIYAQRLAGALPKADHHFFEFDNGEWVKEFAGFHVTLTEGFHSWIHAHGISVLPAVRELIEVNLSGLHGAELNWEDSTLYSPPDEVAFLGHLYRTLSQKTTWPSLDEADEALLYAPSLASQMRGRAFESLQQEVGRQSHLSWFQRATHFSFNVDRRLFQYYVMFNRSHVEVRFPFYDADYFEFAHSLPPEMLFDRKLRRAIIRREMPALARIPYDKDNIPISAVGLRRTFYEVSHRAQNLLRRKGVPLGLEPHTLYADYENWLRSNLKTWGEQWLFGVQPTQRGIFAPQAVRSLWERFQSGQEANFIGKIAPLMTYEMLLQHFGL